MKQRIGSIDGWRMIAALGVLYTHSWTALKNPPLNIGHINLMQFLNLWGSGVQMFFVISGFCFYLVLSRWPAYNLRTAAAFWKKRWLRIAPAFYVACTCYAFTHYSLFSGTIAYRLFFNYLFLQNVVPNVGILYIFWSLSVEWQFYLLLPLIFLLIRRLGVVGVVALILTIQVIIDLFHYKGMLMPGDEWYYTIFCNFGHFAWGILLAWLYTNRWGIAFFSKPMSILAGFTLAYTGKLLFFSAFLAKMGGFGFVFQTLGPLIMTMGFACMIFSCLESKTLSTIWGNKYFSALGRVSYSFYLWHAFILEIVFEHFKNIIPWTGPGVFLLMLIVLIILIPVSFISYRLFESFYFRMQPSAKLAKQYDAAPR
jgi:peptidoglycan/LPS O-acetylase OafA/YrhL